MPHNPGVSDPDEPDTLNRFAVTAHQGKIVSLSLGHEWTPDEARSLAAWLVVALQMNDGDNGRELEKVGELVRAIKRA